MTPLVVTPRDSFRNVFGHDEGSMFQGAAVTHERVTRLLAHVANGGTSNGVGGPQLTSEGFIRQAERLGGAHIVKYQLRVAFRLLAQLIDKHGLEKVCAAYNAGEAGWRSGQAYSKGLASIFDEGKPMSYVNCLKPQEWLAVHRKHGQAQA